MKLEICSFSGYKIYPAQGKTFVRGDSRVFRFINSKTESLFHQRKNPRKISWTVIFRKMHKKGITEEIAKKRTRKAVKYQRSVVGASLEQIKAKRNMKIEERQSLRKDAIEKAKAQKKAAEQKKQQEKSKQSTGAKKQQQAAQRAQNKARR